MKHKIQTINRADFNAMWEDLMKKISEVGETIIKTKIRLVTRYSSLACEYEATVWTERKEKETE